MDCGTTILLESATAIGATWCLLGAHLEIPDWRAVARFARAFRCVEEHSFLTMGEKNLFKALANYRDNEDAVGNRLPLSLTGGQVHDITQAETLAAEAQPKGRSRRQRLMTLTPSSRALNCAPSSRLSRQKPIERSNAIAISRNRRALRKDRSKALDRKRRHNSKQRKWSL
jgi:hypothetical protein